MVCGQNDRFRLSSVKAEKCYSQVLFKVSYSQVAINSGDHQEYQNAQHLSTCFSDEMQFICAGSAFSIIRKLHNKKHVHRTHKPILENKCFGFFLYLQYGIIVPISGTMNQQKYIITLEKKVI